MSGFRDDSGKRILFLGAGLSSIYAIQYLAAHSKRDGYLIRLGDVDLHKAEAKVCRQ
jgi:hypothetical protein